MRSNDECRTYDIIRTINERRAYDFNVELSTAWHLCNKGCDILKYVIGKHGLNQENVVVALNSFQDTEIIDISVAVKVHI